MFLVVFRNRKRAGIDAAAYEAEADRMLTLARAQPGFRDFRSYTAEDGEVVAISEWTDEASARAWGRHVEHAPVQRRGRGEFYEDYTLFACENPRIHSFERQDS